MAEPSRRGRRSEGGRPWQEESDICARTNATWPSISAFPLHRIVVARVMSNVWSGRALWLLWVGWAGRAGASLGPILPASPITFDFAAG
jgi:hypothetical protein